jgi:glyoxylase-like metal-dependent hydrolase (beta-lactamase superfamily II)
MFLDVFSDNSFETNCWMLGTEGTDDAVVVDPGFSPQRVHAMLETEGKRPVAALATHGHYDHIGAAAEFCGDDLPLFIHGADVLALTDAQAWGGSVRGQPPVPVKDVRILTDGDVLTFAGFEIEVVHTQVPPPRRGFDDATCSVTRVRRRDRQATSQLSRPTPCLGPVSSNSGSD